MGVYQTRVFARFARKERLAVERLLEAARNVVEGKFDADLGGGLFKQRVARDGGGKSGGFRTILAFRRGGHCFFVYGFAKSKKANVSGKELEALKRLAEDLFGYESKEIGEALKTGELVEATDGEDAKG